MNNYIPKPADTADIRFPEDLNAIAEAIAENVHEVWASSRQAEGWTYGPVRDDAKKQTPCLVPYSELPEEEKAYDRKTAFETLKYIVSMGYDIVRKTGRNL